MLKPSSLIPALMFAGLLFVIDALMVNGLFMSMVVAGLQVILGIPFLILKRDERRQRLRNIGIFVGTLILVFVMTRVNAHVAPSNAARLIAAIESYRAATGVYPKSLQDLVPRYIDRVPRAQYTIDGQFWYLRGGTTEPPMFWYNPHGMDHRMYRFDSKDWGYLG